MTLPKLFVSSDIFCAFWPQLLHSADIDHQATPLGAATRGLLIQLYQMRRITPFRFLKE